MDEKNSVPCQNQSDCMVYKILQAHTLRKNDKDCYQIVYKERDKCLSYICKMSDNPTNVNVYGYQNYERANMTFAPATHKVETCLGGVSNQL